VKEWQKELYIYRLNPAPPRINDLQEYIELYLKEKDNTYFNWFMHYYEPTLNSTAMDTVQQYAMYGHFLDIKEACVFGIVKALNSYELTRGVPFLTYKTRIMWEEIHEYIRSMRRGFP
jgi:DNA-directed RNA polymerase specialized sigma subunit